MNEKAKLKIMNGYKEALFDIEALDRKDPEQLRKLCTIRNELSVLEVDIFRLRFRVATKIRNFTDL